MVHNQHAGKLLTLVELLLVDNFMLGGMYVKVQKDTKYDDSLKG